MSLKLKVKAGNIQHLTDARYFSAMLVDYMGFPVADMSALQIKEIIPWISGPKMVLEFNDAHGLEEIFRYIAEADVNLIQVGHDASLEIPAEVRRIYTYRIDTYEALRDIRLIEHPSTECHLIELEGLSSEDVLEKPEALKALSSSQTPILLDLNISEESIVQFHEAFPSIGLHLRGSAEEKVGQKAFDLMDAILEALEED